MKFLLSSLKNLRKSNTLIRSEICMIGIREKVSKSHFLMGQSLMMVVFDTETSGLIENPARKLDSQPEIISIAIQSIDLEKAEIFDHYYCEFKPLKPISANITEITGITNERLEIAPSIESQLPYIIPRLRGAPVLIGQNIRFDMDMIELECRRYQYPSFKWPRILDLVQNTIH